MSGMIQSSNKYIVITHYILGSKCCASEAFLSNTLEEGRSKAFEIINNDYRKWIEEEEEEEDIDFKIIEPSETDYDIFMSCDEKYVGNKGYGRIVTITKV